MKKTLVGITVVGKDKEGIVASFTNFVFERKGNLEKGVRIGKGHGILKVISYSALKEVIFPPDLDMRHADHTIIATAKAVQMNPDSRKTILVSRDINMRVICDSIGLEAEDYVSEKAISSFEELYNGFIVQSFDDEVVDRFYSGEDIILTEDEAEATMFPNQYIMMVSNANVPCLRLPALLALVASTSSLYSALISAAFGSNMLGKPNLMYLCFYVLQVKLRCIQCSHFGYAVMQIYHLRHIKS